MDHVSLPLEWTGKVVKAGIETEMDLSIKRTDHRSPHVVFDLPDRKDMSQLVMRRKQICDRETLVEERTLDEIAKDLKRMPAIPWTLEPASHQLLLQRYVHDVLRRHAPTVRLRWMDEATYGDVRSKATCARDKTNANTKNGWPLKEKEAWSKRSRR